MKKARVVEPGLMIMTAWTDQMARVWEPGKNASVNRWSVMAQAYHLLVSTQRLSDPLLTVVDTS